MKIDTKTALKSGRVASIKSDVVEIEFLGEKPRTHELLVFKEDPDTKLEVYNVDLDNIATCICFQGSENLYRGAEILRTGETIKIPVGEGTLGRLIDVYGNPIDSLGPLNVSESSSIYNNPPN